MRELRKEALKWQASQLMCVQGASREMPKAALKWQASQNMGVQVIRPDAWSLRGMMAEVSQSYGPWKCSHCSREVYVLTCGACLDKMGQGWRFEKSDA